MKTSVPTVMRTGISACFVFSLIWLCGCAPAPPPTITPSISSTQPYPCPNTVSLYDSNGAATIYFSLNGGSYGTYNGPFAVQGPNATTVAAYATVPHYSQSATVAANFCAASTPNPPNTPTFNPASGQNTCPTNVQVNVASAPQGTTVYVTNNGTTPSSSNNIFSGAPGSTLPVNGGTLKAIACAANSCSPVAASGAYTCTQPPAATYDTIEIQIQTGNDNADQNLDIEASINGPGSTHWSGHSLCLKLSNDSSLQRNQGGTSGVGQWGYACADGASSAPSWSNGHKFDLNNTVPNMVPIKLPGPLTQQQLAASTMTISALQSGCSLSCSNWDIQAATITFTDSTGTLQPKTIAMGSFINSGWNDNNCIARLKAPSNATSVQFSLGSSSQATAPILYLTYANGNEANQIATCKDNGDGGTVP